jgi:AAA domain-containing protein
MASTHPLVLLSGPAGAGKSSTAAGWAARGTAARAVIDVDGLRMLIRAGVALPEYGWNAETERQWTVAADLWMAMVRVYHRHKVACIVDVYAPPSPEDPWRELYAELGLRRIVLLPNLETCLERNRIRNRRPLLTDDQLRSNYEDFAWCVEQAKPAHVIDNSELTLEQTVDAVEAEVAKPGITA